MEIIGQDQFTVGTISASGDWTSPRFIPARGATHVLVSVRANLGNGPQKVGSLTVLGTNGSDPEEYGSAPLDQKLVNDGITGSGRQLFVPGGAGSTIALKAPCPYASIVVQVVPVEAGGDLTDVEVEIITIAE